MTFGTDHPAGERTRAAVDVAIERIAALGAGALIHALRAPSAFPVTGSLGGVFVAAVAASVALAGRRAGDAARPVPGTRPGAG